MTVKRFRRLLANGLYRLAARVSPWPEDEPRTPEDAARYMVGEAYQVVGFLAYALDEPGERPTDAEIERALDYFSDGAYRVDFLPWPRETAS